MEEMKGLFIMDKELCELVYPPAIKSEIEQLANIYAPVLTAEEVMQDPSILQEVEVIFSGWGGPALKREFLEAAPHLKAVFYAAGTIKQIMTDAAWERNVRITTANAANAVPVAEYTLSQILFSLKGGWGFVRDVRRSKVYPRKPFAQIPGAFRSTVGLVSLSTVGRKVNELLQHFDLKVIAYDQVVGKEEAKQLNVELCSLEEIFEKSDVVSLHAPLLDKTIGMIKGGILHR